MNTNSVGEFRLEEIDGKPFLMYNLLSQTDSISSSSSGETAIDPGSDDLSSQPLFICPDMRFRRRNCGPSNWDGIARVVVPPQFPRTESGHQQLENMLDSDSCKLPLLPLFWCNNKEPNDSEFKCRACKSTELRSSYYLCVTCGHKFHKECVGSPLEFKHPSYPSLSLQLSSLSFDISFSCPCCNIMSSGISYRCPSSNFNISFFCAFKPISYVIDHPKRHPHTLTFFPKQAFLPCIVCGLIIETIPTYVCLPCVFVVHEKCIYFPYVIRISRHRHRISYTPSLPSGVLSCGVCRKKVDNDYGAYSCNKCDDHYVVHSRCALRRDLWDGEELEGIPEEPEIIVEPFERIADGVILHFSHGHNLKLEMSLVYDQHKFCQACILPIYEGSYYSCMDGCDFILHEACANEPCKKYHPLHFSPLTLVVDTDGYCYKCDACRRQTSGFIYESIGPPDEAFRLCIRCASVSEPFDYQGHEHSLFLNLNPEEEKLAFCQICQIVRKMNYCSRILNCIDCDFVICFKCATLPYKARYQHDKHLLTFYEAKDAKDHSEWCDACERKIGESIYKNLLTRNRLGFYSCDECCTTLHTDCLLGEDMYLKPGQIFYDERCLVIGNNTLSRPICMICSQRCPQKVVFVKKHGALCAGSCLATWLVEKREESEWEWSSESE